MKYILLLLLLVGCGGTYKVEPEPVEGETTHTFGPDFEAWLTYCQGKAQYKYEIGDITQNEIDLEIKECYYSTDFNFPTIEEIDTTGEQNVSQ